MRHLLLIAALALTACGGTESKPCPVSPAPECFLQLQDGQWYKLEPNTGLATGTFHTTQCECAQ